ncbi:hypothetical protein ACLVWU_11995 [Bdellovibrio sp. HCB290]|uniref:hypothetical protein n=1 Tax=Bdellovibrio sp. HCB290 TaxID=3394356 RepID=UPI0039B4B910
MMKQILILAFIAIATSNAFAGSFGLSCKTDNPSVQIGKGYVTLNGKKFDYYSADRLGGTFGIVDFLKEQGPKVVVSVPDVPTDVAQGGFDVISEKNFKDDCGNEGTETKYRAAVGIYSSYGSTLVPVVRIVCEERVLGGHCL